MKTLNIGLCGSGNVGLSFIDVVHSNREKILKKYGIELNIPVIGVRKGKIENKGFVGEIEKDILKVPFRDDVDVIVELIGGTDVSFELAMNALKNNKHFVTANKALMATKGKALYLEASKRNLHIGLEASVAGGIPIIRTLRDGLISNDVNWFAGILNGTSNFIFSKMKSEKKSFSDSLKLAQELGFAESDPSFDINGTDAAQKTSILSTISFAADINTSDVYFEGIEHIDSQDMEYGEQLGFTLKPISIGRSSSSGISMGSFPAFIKKDEILASINNESNVVEINTKNLNSTAFSGPGAGGYPTACSVLNDVIDIGQGKVFDYSKLLKKQNVLDFDSYISSRYLKIMIKDEMGAVADVSALIARKKLSIDNLIQKDQDKDNELVPLVIVLGASQEKIVQELIEDLSKLPIVEGNVKHIRIFSP